ncbi:MAG: hypothetical protein KGL18_02275 [Burkholderiales bacterium]|nr:hypothetical protein [Burkholderiales bacterium]MDE2501794.1 hypothetical protein [Burkholderiales bacterium]
MISATPAQRAAARHDAWRCSRDGELNTPAFLSNCATLDGQALAVDARGEIVPLLQGQGPQAQDLRVEVGDWAIDFRAWCAGRAQADSTV